MADKVLVIGGSRFVGPHLIELLQKNKWEITVFNRGTVKRDYGSIKFVKGDRKLGFSELNGSHYDVVYDMCSYEGEDTQRLIDEVSFDFLVHFGTIASYKKPIVFPINESYEQGEWFFGDYGKGKFECEQVLINSNIRYASLRPTYILGAENYIDRENFIYQRLIKGQDILIPGDGSALTQFVFVDEVANSLHTLGTKRLAGAFNCVGDESITLLSLVEQMAVICDGKLNVKFDPEHDGAKWDDDIFPFANENTIFDNSKIKEQRVRFSPLIDHLKNDWDNYYSKNFK